MYSKEQNRAIFLSESISYVEKSRNINGKLTNFREYKQIYEVLPPYFEDIEKEE